MATRMRLFILLCPLATLGCECPRKYMTEEATSPRGEYIVRSYSSRCGPLTPFNEQVGLKRTGEFEYDDVLTIVEAPYSATFKWTGAKSLQIIIDCRDTRAAGCIRSDRHITIEMRKRWKDVQIDYRVGPRLTSFGAGDILERHGSSPWWPW